MQVCVYVSEAMAIKQDGKALMVMVLLGVGGGGDGGHVHMRASSSVKRGG